MNNSDKIKIEIISEYMYLINNIMAELTCNEETIIKYADLGTVKDGCKKIYSDECKKIISEILSNYYSVDNTDSIIKYKNILVSRLENEYNYKVDKTTEKIAKSWATQMVINRINSFIRSIETCAKTINESQN